MVAKIAEICTAALLSYFFIILRETEMENVYPSDIWNVRTVS